MWDWDVRAGKRGGTARRLCSGSSRPFRSLEPTIPGLELDEEVVAQLRDVEAQEALYVTEGAADIYPSGGGVITRPMHFETSSISGQTVARGWRPGVRRYTGLRLRSRSDALPAVLSFRMSAEKNYFHFLAELIGGRLRLAEQVGVPVDTPIVVSEYLAERPFFKEVQRLPVLADRRWLLQSGRELITSERVYFAQTSSYEVANLDYIRRVFEVSDSDRSSSDRLFLARDPEVGRTFSNLHEVADVCQRYGFRIVDPGRLTLAQQIETFAAAGHVVGTHGAGLTNIIFRQNAPLQVLELFPSPPPYFCFMYFLIARHFGFAYRAMASDSLEPHPWVEPFAVDPRLLSARIEAMLELSGD